MPSRKRNQGKARKATRGGNRQSFPQSNPSAPPPRPKFFWSESWLHERAQRLAHLKITCGHGDVGPFSMESYFFRSTLDLIISQKLGKTKTLIEALIESFPIAVSSCTGNLDDRDFRESVMAVYLSIGANSCLSFDAGYKEEIYIGSVAGAILFLESYEEHDFKARCIKLKMKLDDVIGGGERAATSFFAKRIPVEATIQLVGWESEFRS